MAENDNKTAPSQMRFFCPVTGLPVYTRPEWQNQHVSGSFTANFWVIGSNIIYSRPTGQTDEASVQASLKINDEVADFVAEQSDFHVQIEDYIGLVGSNSKARRLFTDRMFGRTDLQCLVFCNLSTAFSIAVNIGKRLNATERPVYIGKHYVDAIDLAITESGQDRENVSAPLDLQGYAHNELGTFSPVELAYGGPLDMSLPGLAVQVVVIDNSIVHSSNTGYLKSAHITPIDEYHQKIDRAVGSSRGADFVIADVTNVSGTSHNARLRYMGALMRWHRRTPFKMYVAYGTNTLLKTAFLLGNAVMPFKVRVAKDLEHAFELVRRDTSADTPAENTEPRNNTHTVKSQELDNLAAYLASISWESQDVENHAEVDSSHPLALLYQSIELVKEEISQLLEERKKFEEQLFQARKMESVGTIAAGVAHDFNNILAIIAGNTDLALHKLPEDAPTRDNLEDIKKASQRAQDVIKQLLEYSRKSDQSLDVLDAVPVIRDAIRLLRATIPSSVQIRENLPDTSINVSSDPTQINQVLMNLFANSAHAMAKTGGTIDVTVEETFIMDEREDRYARRQAGEYMKLSVSDTGPGISPDCIDRIFDPYFTTKEVGGGSGMGLAVVLGIVNAHGGSIKVDSKPGLGTTFTMLFPLAHEQQSVALKTPEQTPVGNESILIIEDEEPLVDVMRRMLERLGYRVSTSTLPRVALSQFESEPDDYDLIITDMTMPSMTGVEVAKSAKHIRADIPVIVCTGFSPLIDPKKADELGIDALVMKPMDMHQTASIVRTVLDDGLRD